MDLRLRPEQDQLVTAFGNLYARHVAAVPAVEAQRSLGLPR